MMRIKAFNERKKNKHYIAQKYQQTIVRALDVLLPVPFDLGKFYHDLLTTKTVSKN